MLFIFAVMLYLLYLQIVVFARVHEISVFRSFIAVMLPLFLLMLTVALAGVAYMWVSSL